MIVKSEKYIRFFRIFFQYSPRKTFSNFATFVLFDFDYRYVVEKWISASLHIKCAYVKANWETYSYWYT